MSAREELCRQGMANDAATMTSTIPARALRMETETPFRQLLVDANQCQKSSEPPCIVEAICTGKD
jgi:hypothetical protein